MAHYKYLDGSYDYGKRYYNEYSNREKTIDGFILNKLRVNLVKRYAKNTVLDIGCGTGSFIKYMWFDNCLKTFGYDVNENSISWLSNKGIFYDISNRNFTYFDTITFFDSFEHMKDHDILNDMKDGTIVIISIPLFDMIDIEKSKHYKPGEHLHYFDEQGLVFYLKKYNFDIIYKTDMEINAGREDIYTFVFRKIHGT